MRFRSTLRPARQHVPSRAQAEATYGRPPARLEAVDLFLEETAVGDQ